MRRGDVIVLTQLTLIGWPASPATRGAPVPQRALVDAQIRQPRARKWRDAVKALGTGAEWTEWN